MGHGPSPIFVNKILLQQSQSLFVYILPVAAFVLQ